MSLTKPLRRCALLLMQVILPLTFWHRVALTLPVTIRLCVPARRVADERNAYDEEVQKNCGDFAPHIGADRVYETRTTQWRIVAKAVAVEPLTLKASGAPRVPSIIRLVGSGGAENTQDGEPVEAVAVMEHHPDTPIDWDDMTVARSVMARLRADAPQINRQQRGIDPYKRIEPAASARLTTAERDRN